STRDASCQSRLCQSAPVAARRVGAGPDTAALLFVVAATSPSCPGEDSLHLLAWRHSGCVRCRPLGRHWSEAAARRATPRSAVTPHPSADVLTNRGLSCRPRGTRATGSKDPMLHPLVARQLCPPRRLLASSGWQLSRRRTARREPAPCDREVRAVHGRAGGRVAFRSRGPPRTTKVP